MPEHFENQEAAKLEDDTVSDATAEKRVDRVAEKAGKKSTKAVQQYDEEHPIFSK